MVTAFLGKFRAFAHFLGGYMILYAKEGKKRKQASLCELHQFVQTAQKQPYGS